MDKIVLCLFDYTGKMAKPWAEEGYRCVCVDIDQDAPNKVEKIEHENIDYVESDIHKYLPPRAEYKAVFAFPPCDNVAVSGARWFKDKGLNGLASAVKNFERARQIVEWAEPDVWMIENPVSTLSTYWREPDQFMHPYEYDGYTDEDNGYTKKTSLWHNEEFSLPAPKMADKKDSRILDEGGNPRVRSQTPQGFANAVFKENH